jgi:hypothetical protein
VRQRAQWVDLGILCRILNDRDERQATVSEEPPMTEREDDADEPSRLIAAAAYLLEGEYKCDSCSQPTKVFTVMAAGPLNVEGDVYVGSDDYSCILRRLEQLPGQITHAAATASDGRFRLDCSKMAGESYFMNHCQHCGGKVGDWYVHNPGAAFFPTHPDDIALVTGQRLEGPFVFDGPNVSSSSWTNDWLEANGVAVPRPPETPHRKPRAKPVPK